MFFKINKLKIIILHFFLIGFFIFLDLYSKNYFKNFLKFQNQNTYLVNKIFNIVVVYNKGISFGLLSNYSNLSKFLVPILVIVAIIYLISLYYKKMNDGSVFIKNIFHFSISIVIAGALGNLIDRLKNGSVFDFLDFHIQNYHWPAFNLADCFVCIGITIIVIIDYFFKKRNENIRN